METPGRSILTQQHKMCMMFAASVFGKVMPAWGGIDNPDHATSGTVDPIVSSEYFVNGQYVAQAGSTNTINIYLDISGDTDSGRGPVLQGLDNGVGLPPTPSRRSNCRSEWHHVQMTLPHPNPTQWQFWRRVFEYNLITPTDPALVTFDYDFLATNKLSITFDDTAPVLYSGFVVYPHAMENSIPTQVDGTPHLREKIGACIYLYATGTKGIISRHKISGGLLAPAAINKVDVVNLTANGLVNYHCEQDEAICFWIGLQNPYDIPIWQFNPPPDFDPLARGLYPVV